MAVYTEFFGLLILSNTVAFVGQGVDFEFVSEDKIQSGKSKLKEFTMKAKTSDCWKKAIEGIERRCRGLGDKEQSYIAIDFTNCHMSKSGRKIYSCSREKQSIEECTSSMDDTTYLVYTNFFTHTANICFYVKSELWNQRTEDTISNLAKTSQDVVAQLEESAQRQNHLLEEQNISLENQKEIISKEIHLTETLKNSTLNAKQAFEDMKQSAKEQKDFFTETFDGVVGALDRVRKLQLMFLGEFISLQSLTVYTVAAFTCYFFTSTPRTAAARLPLFVGLFVLIFIERLVTSWGVKDTQIIDMEAIQTRLNWCRLIYIIVAIVELMIAGCKYKDYNKINFDKLHDMQLQLTEINADVKEILKAVVTNREFKQQSLQEERQLSQQSVTPPSYSNHVTSDISDASIDDNLCTKSE